MSAIAELRRMEAAATPGPWPIDPHPERDGWAVLDELLIDGDYSGGHWFRNSADAALIAAMRNALPALLDVAEAADEFAGFVPHYGTRKGGWEAKQRLWDALARLDGAKGAETERGNDHPWT